MTYIIGLIVGPRYDHAGRGEGRETASVAPDCAGAADRFV